MWAFFQPLIAKANWQNDNCTFLSMIAVAVVVDMGIVLLLVESIAVLA